MRERLARMPSARGSGDVRAGPEWASLNLCVLLCDGCAGAHRGLGVQYRYLLIYYFTYLVIYYFINLPIY